MSKKILNKKTPAKPKAKKQLRKPPHPSLKELSEAELLGAINYVVNSLAGGFVFGWYSREDIEQEARCLAFEALPDFNPNFKKKGTLEEKLRSFLFIHIRRRLINLKRDKQGRSPEKHRLVFPLHIDDINDIDERNMKTDDDVIDITELRHFRDKILYELDSEFRDDYHKVLAGVSIPKANKERLLVEIMRIIKE